MLFKKLAPLFFYIFFQSLNLHASACLMSAKFLINLPRIGQEVEDKEICIENISKEKCHEICRVIPTGRSQNYPDGIWCIVERWSAQGNCSN